MIPSGDLISNTLSKWVEKIGLGPKDENVTIGIILEGEETRRTADSGEVIYMDGETVKGQVVIDIKDDCVFEHTGIRVEFIGSCELIDDSANSLNFVSLVRNLAPQGEINKKSSYDFEFSKIEKPHDSYHGLRVRLRYLVRVVIGKWLGEMEHEREIWVQKERMDEMEPNRPIKLEVGIGESLHIECEYLKSSYHLYDSVIGRAVFLLVRLKVKIMEVTLIKVEQTGLGVRRLNQTETIASFQIMDGTPVKGESIPIRLFLGAYPLGPTMNDICQRFSVKYYLNLVLYDEDDRRYFKQEEIILFRK
eukprot:Ihof_evm4s244 gene=Ihof_evmTU4s244